MPARMIETITSFLPSMTVPLVVSSGVSTATSWVGVSRSTS